MGGHGVDPREVGGELFRQVDQVLLRRVLMLRTEIITKIIIKQWKKPKHSEYTVKNTFLPFSQLNKIQFLFAIWTNILSSLFTSMHSFIPSFEI